MNEERHGDHTVDVAGIEAEEDTAEHLEGTHHVDFDGDGGFDLIKVVGCK